MRIVRETGKSTASAAKDLGVSQSWFHEWRDRAPTVQRRRRADLDAAVTTGFDAYGSPRIARDLNEHGRRVSQNTVASRVAELDLMPGCGTCPGR